MSGTEQAFKLGFGTGDLLSAWQTSHIETPIGAAMVKNGERSGSLLAKLIKTYLVKPADSSQPLDEMMFLPLIGK